MKIRLENEFLCAEVSTRGGAIESIVSKRDGREHCWTYDPALWPRRTSICFPICSVLRGGTYTHQGKSYELPAHGFMRDCEFETVVQEKDRVVMVCTDTEATRLCYPFAFRFELEERLEDSTLVVEYRISNPGAQPLYFSVGSHYTYALPAPQKACCYRFTSPQHARRLLLEGGVVQGKGESALSGAQVLSMDGLFDVSSSIFETADLHTEHIAIGTADGDFTRVSYSGFPYTVLWAPKGNDSPFACIEAWAGMADYAGRDSEIAHKEGIQTALPGEMKNYVQRIAVMQV